MGTRFAILDVARSSIATALMVTPLQCFAEAGFATTRTNSPFTEASAFQTLPGPRSPASAPLALQGHSLLSSLRPKLPEASFFSPAHSNSPKATGGINSNFYGLSFRLLQALQTLESLPTAANQPVPADTSTAEPAQTTEATPQQTPIASSTRTPEGPSTFPPSASGIPTQSSSPTATAEITPDPTPIPQATGEESPTPTPSQTPQPSITSTPSPTWIADPPAESTPTPTLEPPTPTPLIWELDSFDDLSPGSLNGQNGWRASRASPIVISSPGKGQLLRVDPGPGDTISMDKLIPNLSAGTQFFEFDLRVQGATEPSLAKIELRTVDSSGWDRAGRVDLDDLMGWR